MWLANIWNGSSGSAGLSFGCSLTSTLHARQGAGQVAAHLVVRVARGTAGLGPVPDAVATLAAGLGLRDAHQRLLRHRVDAVVVDGEPEDETDRARLLVEERVGMSQLRVMLWCEP